MMTLLEPTAVRVLLVGAGATATMDLWLWLQKRALGMPSLDFALVGRWVGHGLGRGRWLHDSIRRAEPLRGERALGWALHYAVGVAFAALLVALAGTAWLREPSLGPALAVGVGTVIAPLFVMQPALGAGIASSRTVAPLRNSLRSVANHAVFGAGLYLAAALIERIAR